MWPVARVSRHHNLQLDFLIFVPLKCVSFADENEKIRIYSEPGSGTKDKAAIVAVGGDGTVNEVASGLVGTDKTLGIIPCGSGDRLALHLGISRNHHKALKQLKNGVGPSYGLWKDERTLFLLHFRCGI